jgi:hypothetical protein
MSLSLNFIERIKTRRDQPIVLLKARHVSGKRLYFFIRATEMEYRKLCAAYRQKQPIDFIDTKAIICFGENEPLPQQLEAIALFH